jgi:hypothetical protein
MRAVVLGVVFFLYMVQAFIGLVVGFMLPWTKFLAG